MASELSLQAVRELLLDKGGIVRNKDLVRYFKEFLNNPATKAQAREKFKEFVNTLCSISSNEQNDKLLVLKAQYLVTDHLPYSATSSQLKSVATPKFELGSPGQDACAQAIASARAIQEGFSLAGPSPIKPKRSAPKPPSHPRVLLGEFGVVTDESEVTRQGMSGENGSKVDGTFDDVSHSPIGTSSEALPDVLVTASSPPPVPLSHSEGGDESPSLLTQIDSMLDDKFPALQRGRPSKLIKERAEAMARSSAASPIEQHNLSQVMMSVAAKAAALAEKRDDSDEEEEVKKAPLQPHAPSTKDRMAATVLNLAEPMVSMTLPSADVTDGATHSVARKTETSSNSERMKALLDSFQHSATLQDTVKQGMSPNRPRSRTVDSCSSPGTSQRWAAMTNSPPVSGQLSPFFARNVPQGPRASLQTRIRKKEKETKDGAGNKQEAPKKHERKEPTKQPGMNGGSDGEDSGDEDDDQGFDSSHVVLDPIEREWLPCSASGVTRRVEQMLQRDASLANKKDFINGVSNLLPHWQYTGLHWAAKIGNEEMLILLLEHGADIHTKTGQTALHLAAKHGHRGIIYTLIEDYSADIYTRDYAGRQPRDIVKAGVSQDTKEILDCKAVEPEIAHTQSSDGLMKCTNGCSSMGDLTDFVKPPLNKKQSFGSSILRASLRRLKGSRDEKKKAKTKIEINVITRPEYADWVREPPIKQSASEGNIDSVDL